MGCNIFFYGIYCFEDMPYDVKGLTLEALCTTIVAFNPLKPYDAAKHHFASLKNDLIS